MYLPLSFCICSLLTFWPNGTNGGGPSTLFVFLLRLFKSCVTKTFLHYRGLDSHVDASFVLVTSPVHVKYEVMRSNWSSEVQNKPENRAFEVGVTFKPTRSSFMSILTFLMMREISLRLKYVEFAQAYC